MTRPTPGTPIVIVGAGLAGLACARVLEGASLATRVLDASDAVGGRVRTDHVTGAGGTYLVDRGFQVYLTAYPEGRRALDTAALGLRTFLPGAKVRFGGRFWHVADPVRSPLAGLAMVAGRSPLLTLGDVAALGALDARLRLASADAPLEAPEMTTESMLRDSGVSDRAIDRFFRPFFGGVFLDRSLRTSARKFRLTYRMFARGRAALPARGMQAIPEQLAAGLSGSVETGVPVTGLREGRVELAGGDAIEAPGIVVATDGTAAHRLIGSVPAPGWKSTVTVSFSAPTPPSDRPILYLDGDGTGPVNHVAVPSAVQPSYAPPGRALVSASIVAPIDPATLTPTPAEAARTQMREWFGSTVDDWEHLRTDTIEHALPSEDSPALQVPRRPLTTTEPGVILAGDYLDNASINGALESGRRAAEQMIATFT